MKLSLILSTSLLMASTVALNWACASSLDMPDWNTYCEGGSHVNCIYPLTNPPTSGKLRCRDNFPYVVLWKNDVKPSNYPNGARGNVNGESCVYACIFNEG
ncbi:hypothetical protein Ptr902_08067 [Pyrenophora tritici-repentis]|nr:hypothetical protein Ptr902_08067 [Pyrenophora tritici-repentis]